MLVFKEEILRNLKALNVLNSWGEKNRALFRGGWWDNVRWIVHCVSYVRVYCHHCYLTKLVGFLKRCTVHKIHTTYRNRLSVLLSTKMVERSIWRQQFMFFHLYFSHFPKKYQQQERMNKCFTTACTVCSKKKI